jgi:hypothetical protein
LESRYRYSKDIVNNNFPWPDLAQNSKPNQPVATVDKSQSAIETAAQAVLDVRARFQSGEQPATLADLYDPPTMPPELLKAHQRLDAAVDKAYERIGGKKSYKSGAERVAFFCLSCTKSTPACCLPIPPVPSAVQNPPHRSKVSAYQENLNVTNASLASANRATPRVGADSPGRRNSAPARCARCNGRCPLGH